jgi:hypothetical protein
MNLIDSMLELSAEIKSPGGIGAGYNTICINEGRCLLRNVNRSARTGIPSSFTTLPLILPSTGVGSGV